MAMMDILSFNIVEAIFDDEPTTSTVLKAALFMSFFWGIFFALASPAIIALLIRDNQWLRKSSDRQFESEKDLWEALGMKYKSSDEFYEFFRKFWPNMQLITFQHTVGGLLCLPSALELLDDSTSASLACFSILSEVGWEISDLVTMLYRRYCLPHGEAIVVSKKCFVDCL